MDRQNENWWEETVFCEIYMPAFAEESGGAFTQLTSRIPYYKELGIGGIWLTPFYPSPKVDNGYDVSDYEEVDAAYGSLADFDRFINTAHESGIRVIADMVLNHTSTSHQWFADSLAQRNGKDDWYIWSPKIPNNWESFFGGSAWEWAEDRREWYYHSFAKEQADLNYRNPEVIDAAADVLTFWLARGIDGFRLDVINNLSSGALCSDNPSDEKGAQLHIHDVNQAGVESILEVLRRRTDEVSGGKAFLVGEISSEELPVIYHYTGDKLLHTTFNFNLGSMKILEMGRFLKELQDMQQLYGEGQPTLFFGSHDMRRSASRFGLDSSRIKALCLFQMTFRGIPFIYYGEEIGMRDRVYRTLADARDCQALLAYEQVKENGGSEEKAMQALRDKSRDYSRSPMNWEEVGRQRESAGSVYHFYKEMLAFRKAEPTLKRGDCTRPEEQGGVISYDRRLDGRTLRILLNLTEREQQLSIWGLYGIRPAVDTRDVFSDTVLGKNSAAVYVLP